MSSPFNHIAMNETVPMIHLSVLLESLGKQAIAWSQSWRSMSRFEKTKSHFKSTIVHTVQCTSLTAEINNARQQLQFESVVHCTRESLTSDTV